MTTRELLPYEKAIQGAKERFLNIAGDAKTYDVESIFAMQAVMKTEWAMKVANANPMSVKLAMINVASTGLTLNPAHGYAYLVPRDHAIVLDISYRGLIKIATDTGSVLWARADLVHEADEFTYHGPAAMPVHKANVFKERGEVVGAYCIAKTHDGDVLTEIMGMDEIEKIRAKSDLYAKKKSGPWVEWFAQMAKKSIIKRASKTWPYTDRSEKLLNAVELANDSEGGYTLDAEVVALVNERQAANIRDALEASNMDAPALLALYGVDAVEALPAARYGEIVATIQEAAHEAA
jgi:recombination protein RecT